MTLQDVLRARLSLSADLWLLSHMTAVTCQGLARHAHTVHSCVWRGEFVCGWMGGCHKSACFGTYVSASVPPPPHPAGAQWVDADDRLARCGGLRRQLVRKGEVSIPLPPPPLPPNTDDSPSSLTRASHSDTLPRPDFTNSHPERKKDDSQKVRPRHPQSASWLP